MTLTAPREVRAWLLAVVLSVLAMIALGGTTRLTQSGLSIVEWAPLMGAVPPLDETQWDEVFARYRAFPQYQIDFPGMQLSEFKSIFFWEYLHRLVGRDRVWFVPLVWFIVRRRISPRLAGYSMIGLDRASGFGLVYGQTGW